MLMEPLSKLDWTFDETDLDPINAYFDAQTFSINLNLLCNSVPNGLGFSQNCQEWLTSLKIKTWDDFVFYSFHQSIKRLMLTLSVSTYHHYRQDLRRFLLFGTLCNPDSRDPEPTSLNLQFWMPRYAYILRESLHILPFHEKQVALELCSDNLVSDTHDTKNFIPPAHSPPNHHRPCPFLTVPYAHSNGGDTDGPAMVPQKSSSDPLSRNDPISRLNLANAPSSTSSSKASPPTNPSEQPSTSRKVRTVSPKKVFPGVSHTPSDFLERQYSPKVQWDGTIGTFREYKLHMEGFYIQNKAWFMFNPTFQALYCQYGLEDAIIHPYLPSCINITAYMVVAARQHLFGAIQISTRKAFSIHKYLNKYRDTLDGILVWIALLKEKDNGGNISVRIQNLLAKSHQPFGHDYPGGLLKFVHDLESTYAELETLGLNIDNHLRKINLLGHLDHAESTVTDFLSQQCRDCHDTFDECIAYLKEYGSRKENVAVTNITKDDELQMD